ncbi:MAG TPA: hypothetical protein VIL45_08275 [Thermoplasmata archaeon]
MATREDFFVALLLGIGPALILLWTSLRRFDRPWVDHTLFDDRRVFGSLAVGLVFGVIASVLTLSLPRVDLTSSLVAIIVTFLFEEGFKLVYLNRRAYRGRFETTFYGVPLGVGAAATAVVATVLWTALDVLYMVEGFVLLVLFSISLSLVNADTGAIIGFGASRGDTWRAYARAVLVRLAHGAFLFPFLIGIENPWALLSVGTSLGFALLLYVYVYRVLLPGTLPDDLRRELRRERRRMKAARD